MTLFWLVIGIMTLGALQFVVVPLLWQKRTQGTSREAINITVYQSRLRELTEDLESGTLSQDQYAQARQDLERGLLADIGDDTEQEKMPTGTHPKRMWVAATVGILMPIVALALYMDRGAWNRMDTAEAVADAGHPGTSGETADVAVYEEGVRAARLGADAVASTLSGYVEGTPKTPGPDLDLVRRLAADVSVPVIAEGRYQTPGQAGEAIEAGAYAIVVGTAITRPHIITRTFAEAVAARLSGSCG